MYFTLPFLYRLDLLKTPCNLYSCIFKEKRLLRESRENQSSVYYFAICFSAPSVWGQWLVFVIVCISGLSHCCWKGWLWIAIWKGSGKDNSLVRPTQSLYNFLWHWVFCVTLINSCCCFCTLQRQMELCIWHSVSSCLSYCLALGGWSEDKLRNPQGR